MTLALKLTTDQLETLSQTLNEFRVEHCAEPTNSPIELTMRDQLWEFEYRLMQRRTKLRYKPLQRKGKNIPQTVMTLKVGEVMVLWSLLKAMPYQDERQPIFAQLDQMKVNVS